MRGPSGKRSVVLKVSQRTGDGDHERMSIDFFVHDPAIRSILLPFDIPVRSVEGKCWVVVVPVLR